MYMLALCLSKNLWVSRNPWKYPSHSPDNILIIELHKSLVILMQHSNVASFVSYSITWGHTSRNDMHNKDSCKHR